MKKLFLTIAAVLMLTSSAHAEGFALGVTGALMKVDASGSETEVGSGTKTNSDGEVTNADASNDNILIGSIYLEYMLADTNWAGENNGFTFGVKHTPGTADVSDDVQKRADTAGTPGTDDDTGNREAQAEIENYMNYYVDIPVMGSAYVKLGYSEMDVNTLESSTATNGTAPTGYGNTSIDGINYGVGFKGVTGNNLSWKVAYEIVDFDTLSLTSTTGNKITADLDTSELNFSLGYRF
mgnify:CR=1 FL=1